MGEAAEGEVGDGLDGAARRPTGRRRGSSGTRAAILDAARAHFAAKGYRAATLRAIAGSAGVDPALIRHFYGSKAALFTATLDVSSVVPKRVAAAMTAGPDNVGERLVRAYLDLWEDPTTNAAMLSVLRSAVADEEASDLLHTFLRTRILDVVAPTMHIDRPALRIGLATSHLLGTAIARYVLRVEPIASTDHDVLVAALAPTIHHYLTGDLDASRITGR